MRDYKQSRLKVNNELMEISGLSNFIYIKGNMTAEPYYKELKNDSYLSKFFVTVSEQKINNKTGGTYYKKDTFAVTFFGKEFHRYALEYGAGTGMKIEVMGNFYINTTKLKNGNVRYHPNIEGVELRLDDADSIARIDMPELWLTEEPEVAEDEDKSKPVSKEDKRDDVLRRFRESQMIEPDVDEESV